MLYANKRALIEKEKNLSSNKLDFEMMEAQFVERIFFMKHKDLRQIEKNRIAMKKLEIKNNELDIKYFKETYLVNVPV